MIFETGLSKHHKSDYDLCSPRCRLKILSQAQLLCALIETDDGDDDKEANPLR
jgi:hypothetical protein